jgi:ATP-dependent RNA helicase SUPV3L1/SUV3
MTHLYEIAERIRSLRGGVAIVIGAMSPQARNSQVELFQSGKVDYLIATDAIGLGLNLDIKHVCFAALRKFDGKDYRELSLAEIGQIAGRAGRYQKDGSFNLSLDCAERHHLSEQAIQYVEAQRFLPVRKIYYRNSDLNFESVDWLLNSLQKRPFRGCLTQQREALDEQALHSLLKDEDIQKKLDSPHRIEFLWLVCRIPDYQQETQLSHFRFLKRIFLELTKGEGVIPDAWVSQQAKRLSNLVGDIPHLLRQMASVRAWAYIANRPDWLHSPGYWIAHFKTLEETLSEALHERLTNRFIDELNSPEERPFPVDLTIEDDVLWAKSMALGYLTSFSFRSNWTADAYFGAKIVRSLGLKHLTSVAKDKYRHLMQERNWHLRSDFQIYYQDIPLGLLRKGKNIRSPQCTLRDMELLDPRQRTHLKMALEDWLQKHIQNFFHLFSTPKDGLRDLHILLQENLGYVQKKNLPRLSQTQRRNLAKSPIRFGKRGLYHQHVYKTKYQKTRFMLYALWHNLPEIPSHPEQTICYKVEWPKGFGQNMGYSHCEDYQIRDDIIDKIHYRKANSEQSISWLGLNKKQWPKFAKVLGLKKGSADN